MKKNKWFLVALVILSAISVFLSPDAAFTVNARTYPNITKDLLDYRPLEDKFSEFNEDFRVSDIKAQMQDYNDKCNYICLWDRDLDASPGTIIYDECVSDDNDPTTRVVISVPKISQDYTRSSLLKDYGVLEVLSFYQTMGQYEYWRAEAILCVYSKAMVQAGHPIRVSVNSDNIFSPFVETSVPMLSYEYVTDDYATAEELLEKELYTGEYLYAYYGTEYLNPVDIDKTVFTANSFNFSEVDLKILVRQAEKLNIATRKPPEELYNDACTYFDFFTLFRDPEEGALDGIYNLRNSNNVSADADYIGFIYINDETVIAVKSDEILIGISARSSAFEDKVSVDTDRLYISSYFKDESKNPKTVNIDSRFPEITQETLKKLIYLLYDSQIDLDSLNINSLNLK